MAPWENVLDALARRLEPAGGRVYLVGGAVRDLVLRRVPRDVDLVVECAARDEERCLTALAALSHMTPVVFNRRPPATHRVVIDDLVVDSAFCPPGGLRAALERRDFTINALAMPLAAATDPGAPAATASILDPFAGLADLESGTIRPVSDTALDDDPLRMLRAVRLAATLPGFAIAPALEEQIRARASSITEVAAERVQAEIDLVLRSPRAGEAVRRMDALGLLTPLLPEISPLRGLRQPARHHDHDAFDHTLHAVEEADRLARGAAELDLPAIEPDDEAVLKWAALLHDVGKAATATVDDDGAAHFYGHESVSAALAEDAMRRLRVPARTIDPVVKLVDLHLRLGALASAGAADRPIRRLVRAAGDLLPLLALLSLADRRAAGGPDSPAREAALIATCRRALALKEEVDAISRAPALLDGREIMEILNLAPGPRVGSIARWIERLTTDGRITTREEAIEILKALPAPKTRD